MASLVTNKTHGNVRPFGETPPHQQTVRFDLSQNKPSPTSNKQISLSLKFLHIESFAATNFTTP